MYYAGQSSIAGREVQVTSSRPSYVNGNGRADYDSRSVRSLSPPPATVEPSATPPHPKSYMDIMSMIQRGERPPNIREINDMPPNPDQPVSNPRLAPKPKPWEATQSQGSSAYPQENSNMFNSYGQDNGSGPASIYQSNGEGGQTQTAVNVQPQAPTQSLQPVAAAPVSKLGTLSPSRFHWSHALLAVGVLAVSGAGTAVVFKNAVVPRLKSWIRKVVNEDGEEDVADKADRKPTLAEEAAAAAKAAAAAASDVARASQEMLVSKTEEKKYFGELLSLLDVQVKEMKSMSNSIRKLEGIVEFTEKHVKYFVTLNTTAVPAPDTARTPTARRACDQWNRDGDKVPNLETGAAATGCRD
nr:peroxisomal membrane protein PEX14 [Tanacetum cinerariifolium]